MVSQTACSVKEDRMGCPVYVNLNYDKVIAGNRYESSLVSAFDGTPAYLDAVDILPYEGMGFEIACRRGQLRLASAFGYEAFSWDGDVLTVREGVESGPLFVWADKSEALGDLYCVEVVPHKQYSKVNIIVVGLLPGEDFGYDIRIKAGCNGLDLYELTPVEGGYCALARSRNAAGYEVIVPRQLRNEVILELLEPSPGHIYAPEDLLGVIDVGKELEAIGFDWKKQDLDDINVVVDFVRMTAAVEVSEWLRDDIHISI